jgi:hypothetical protein
MYMLETFGQDAINIHRLSTEITERKPERLLDPERLFTDEEKEEIRHLLIEKLSDKKERGSSRLGEELAAWETLYPSEPYPFQNPLTEEELSAVKRRNLSDIAGYKEVGNDYGVILCQADILKISSLLVEDITNLRNLCDKLLRSIKEITNEASLQKFLLVAASRRIFLPDEEVPGLQSLASREIVEQKFIHLKKGMSLSTKLFICESLKVLVADRVEVTSSGIKLTYEEQKDWNDSAPPFPETPNYKK